MSLTKYTCLYLHKVKFHSFSDILPGSDLYNTPIIALVNEFATMPQKET
jgi:hypothetical protein